MSDPIIYLPSVVLGAILVAIYIYISLKKKLLPLMADIVNLILLASGIVAGVLLILSTFFIEIKKILNGIDLYILIGGVALIHVSIKGVRELLKNNNGDANNNDEQAN